MLICKCLNSGLTLCHCCRVSARAEGFFAQLPACTTQTLEGRVKEQDGIKAKKIIQFLNHPLATACRAS